MGFNKRLQELENDRRVFKYSLISKKIIPSDIEYIKILEEKLLKFRNKK